MLSRNRLDVSVAGHLSDRVFDLYTGAVVPEGINLHYFASSPGEAFRRLLRGEFDAGEMSLSTFIIKFARGDGGFVAIPVFPSRTFRHSAVYIRTSAGIAVPHDLVGRRVGVPEYQMTAAVWVRGFLEHEYGVRPHELEWVTGGLRDPGRRGLIDVEVPGIRISHRPDRSLEELLLAGEIDAIIAPQQPLSFTAGSPEVARLFPDYREVEAEYYRKTRLFPIMHTVVLSRQLYETHPWVAASLYEAFDRAKAHAVDRLLMREPLPVSLPWVQDEIDRTLQVMGSDFWPYGLEPNELVLEAACAYLVEQGLCDRQVEPRELFAPTVIDLAGMKVL